MSWSDRAKAALDNGGDALLVNIEQALSGLGVCKPDYYLVSCVEEYIYLRTAILWAATKEEYQGRLTTDFYTAIAKAYVKKGYIATTKQVEAAISKEVQSAWYYGDTNAWQALFGYSADTRRNVPTNFQFISTIAKTIAEKNG